MNTINPDDVVNPDESNRTYFLRNKEKGGFDKVDKELFTKSLGKISEKQEGGFDDYSPEEKEIIRQTLSMTSIGVERLHKFFLERAESGFYETEEGKKCNVMMKDLGFQMNKFSGREYGEIYPDYTEREQRKSQRISPTDP